MSSPEATEHCSKACHDKQSMRFYQASVRPELLKVGTVRDRVQLRRCWQDKASTTSHRRQLMHCPATMQPDSKFVHVQCVQMKFKKNEHEMTGAFTAVAVALGLAI